MIKQLLDGNLESNQYEDMLRDMFGIYAYVAFTLDKVVQNIVRQLQHMVADEMSQQCTNMFLEEVNNNATGGSCATAQSRAANETNYLRRAEQLLEDENCYKATIYKNEAKLTFELLDNETQDSEEGEEKWSNYGANNDYFKDPKSKTGKKWFLSRNVRRYMEREEKLTNLAGGSINNNAFEKETTNSDKGNDKESNCVLNSSSCRRLLVFNNGDHVFFYRHHRPTKSRHIKLNDLKRRKFDTWRTKWIKSNLSSEQIKKGIEWLGKTGNASTATSQT